MGLLKLLWPSVSIDYLQKFYQEYNRSASPCLIRKCLSCRRASNYAVSASWVKLLFALPFAAEDISITLKKGKSDLCQIISAAMSRIYSITREIVGAIAWMVYWKSLVAQMIR